MSSNSIDQFKEGLSSLNQAIESLSTQPSLGDNSISGDAINGGCYTEFRSTGIIDLAKNQTLKVKDDGIHVKNIHTKNIVGDVEFPGDVEVKGKLNFDSTELESRILNEVDARLAVSKAKIDHTSIPFGALKGNHIRGGKIAELESTGIKDQSSKHTILLVHDQGITVDNIQSNCIGVNRIHSKNLNIDAITNISNNLTVNGEIFAKKVNVEEYVADTRLERTEPLQFHADEGSNIYGKGLLWVGNGPTRQLLLNPDPDRFYMSEHLDIRKEKEYHIGGTSVLSKDKLGDTVVTSKLTKVGTLQNLKTTGSVEIDQYIFYSHVSNRLGFGIEEPNGTIGIASLDNDFVIDVEGTSSKIGNFSSTPLNIITDNVPRIQISATGNKIVIGSNIESKTIIQGKIGINVNSPDCDIVTAGPVKFEDKKFSVGSEAPRQGVWKQGDVVWNEMPRPTGWVGWVCIRDGSPGEWKPFGQIGK